MKKARRNDEIKRFRTVESADCVPLITTFLVKLLTIETICAIIQITRCKEQIIHERTEQKTGGGDL